MVGRAPPPSLTCGGVSLGCGLLARPWLREHFRARVCWAPRRVQPLVRFCGQQPSPLIALDYIIRNLV
eukprot:4643329-Prymnesium_polylepis.1